MGGRRTYTVAELSGQLQLSISGEAACVDAGGYETYH